MNIVHIANTEDLLTLTQNATSDRTRQWVQTVLCNHLTRTAQEWAVPNTTVESEGKSCILLDTQPTLLLTARDAAVSATALSFNRKPFEVFDPWNQSTVWEHYKMGCACVRLVVTDNTRNTVHHICEALDALYPVGDLSRVSVAQALKAADDWTARLWRNAVAAGGQTHNTFVFVHENETWGVFQLLDKAAYEAEGANMHHCVASYWGRDCTIYSLRRRHIEVTPDGPVESWTRCATIEVRDARVQQIRGDHNRRPEMPVLEALDCWLQHAGIQPEPTTLNTGYLGVMDGVRFINGDPRLNLAHADVITQGIVACRPPQNFVAEFAAIDNCELTMTGDSSMPRVQISGVLTPQGLEALRAALSRMR